MVEKEASTVAIGAARPSLGAVRCSSSTSSGVAGSARCPVKVPDALEVIVARPEARVRLICFPWAGAQGPEDYRRMKHWKDGFPNFVEIAAFHWSGRGRRSHEPVWTDFEWIPGEVEKCHAYLAEKPFALFGHSMGSTAVYEWARYLALNTSVRPLQIFVSGAVPPQLQPFLPKLGVKGLDPDQQCQKIEQLSGGNVKASHLKANNYALLEKILPTLGVDFDLADTYKQRIRRSKDKQPVLECDISCFVGEKDALCGMSMHGWQEMTSGRISVRKFSGDHFYLLEQHGAHQPVLAACIAGDLAGRLSTSKL